MRPEGEAIARAEAARLGELGTFDPMRMHAEDDWRVAFRTTGSVTDRAVRTTARPTRIERWMQQRLDAG